MEYLPEGITLDSIVPGYSPHIGQFVAQRDHLHLAAGTGKPVDGGLLAVVPAFLLGDSFGHLVALGGHQGGDAVTELGPDTLHRDIRVFNGVVQGGCGQEFLVGSHCRHDLNGLQRMDYIRIALPTAFRAGVRPDREYYRPVKQFRIQGSVRHSLLVHERKVLGLLQQEFGHIIVPGGRSVKGVQHQPQSGTPAAVLQDVGGTEVLRGERR